MRELEDDRGGAAEDAPPTSLDAEATRGHDAGEVTRLLRRWRRGDAVAQERLFAVVYEDLRQLAGGLMRDERTGHTLPPTG
ncbi:MAG: ECF-type sigma factor, partial [Acidobacteriota bacterium]